jgi:N-methylhydantoinase B
VRDDVLAHFVSFESARDIYGVVFEEEVLSDELRVDETATKRQRAALRKAR